MKKYDWENGPLAEDGGEVKDFPTQLPIDHKANEKFLDDLIEKRKDPNLTSEEKKVLDEQINALLFFERLSR